MVSLAEAALAELSHLTDLAGSAQAARFLQPGAAGARAIAGFDANGVPSASSADLPAEAFGDYYKCSMLPVFRRVEAALSDDLHVVFALNVRTAAAREVLAASARSNGSLYTELCDALRALSLRRFDRAAFERACTDVPIDKATVDAVCGPPGEPRALVDQIVIGRERDAVLPDRVFRQAVTVRVFLREASAETEPFARLHVEAEGPWHRVSWVETPLMQAVHETFLRHRLGCPVGASTRAAAPDAGPGEQSGPPLGSKASTPPAVSPYARWLARALCRCARAVDAANEAGVRVALFSGRRCGGLAWLLLQNAYCEAHLVNPLGTSSVYATDALRQRGIPALQPAGTHAHELSMVLSACFPHLDEMAGGTVATGVLGHALYLALSRPSGDATHPHRSHLMPMLPDTLGTRAFLKTAAVLRVPPIAPFHADHRGRSLLEACGAARHDSGSAQSFVSLLRAACSAEHFERLVLMTSEISKAKDLAKATEHGYAAIGAGGFFGDSEKAWPDTKMPDEGGAQSEDASKLADASMAVKPIAAYVSGVRTRAHPIKLGDPSEEAEANGAVAGGAKIEMDATMSVEERATCRKRAERLAEFAVRPQLSEAEATELNGAFAELLERILRSGSAEA